MNPEVPNAAVLPSPLVATPFKGKLGVSHSWGGGSRDPQVGKQ